MQVKAAKAEAERELAALREQLDLTCQAQTQAKLREASEQDQYEERVLQLQRSLQGLSSELEVARSSQRDSNWKMSQIHQQMKVVESQK
jgi:hypothetical protein